MTNALKQSAQAVIDNHVTGHVVGGVTMSAGWGAKLMGFVPSTFTEGVACLGGLLSVVLIVKHVYGIINLRLEIKEREQRIEKNLGRRKDMR